MERVLQIKRRKIKELKYNTSNHDTNATYSAKMRGEKNMRN